MGNDFTTAAAMFAQSQGPVSQSFVIFATLYTAFFGILQGAQASLASSLATDTANWVRLGAPVALMLWGFATLFRDKEGGVLGEIAIRVAAPIAVVLVVLATDYPAIVQALIGQINSWSSIMTGGTGGNTLNGGVPFDTLWNHAFGAGVAVWARLSPVDLGGMILVGLYMLIAAVAITFAFVLFAASQFTLYVLLALGPIFFGFAAFQYTRFLFKGFVSAVASVVCAQIIVVTLLGIAFTGETTILAMVWQPGGGGAPANANIWSLIGSLLSVAAVLVACTYGAFKASSWAVGICGGIYDSIAPWAAASAGAIMAGGRGAAGAVKGALSGGGSGAGTAVRPAMAFAGRAMSAP